MKKIPIATAAEPPDGDVWPLIMLSPDDDAPYNAQMAALLEARILDRLWRAGEARTLHGRSRAELQALASAAASFASGQNGFDLVDPPAGILDALEARAAIAPPPVDPAIEAALQHDCIDILERTLQRAQRRGDDPDEIRSIETAIRAHRRRAAKLRQRMAASLPAHLNPAIAQRAAATDPAFH